MIDSTQITNIKTLAFIAVLVFFKLFSRKVLLINRKDNKVKKYATFWENRKFHG